MFRLVFDTSNCLRKIVEGKTILQNYPVNLVWEGADCPGGESRGGLEVFPVNHAVPFSKVLTFYRTEAFSLHAVYSGQVPYPDLNIGEFLPLGKLISF